MTGPPIGAPAVHTHAIPTNRNSALHRRLGDFYDDLAVYGGDPNYTGTQQSTYPPTSGTAAGPGPTTTIMSPTTMYLLGGLLLVGLLEITRRR